MIKGGKDLEYWNGSLYGILSYKENNETGLVIVRKIVEKIKQCVKCMT